MSNKNLKSKSVGVAAHSDPHHKGITLIALIITIIVMMILVAVSVTVALDGGLFGTAKDAASKTQIEAEKEMLLSAVVGAIGTDAKVDLNKIQLPEGFIKTSEGMIESPNGNRFTVSEDGGISEVGYKTQITGLGTGVTLVPYEELTGELKIAADEGKIVAVLKETKDGIEYQAVIPAGFEVSTKDGENTISGGLVVSDANENEFVWVPCTTDESNASGLIQYAQDKQYNDGTIASKQWEYKNYGDWTDEGGNSQSVTKYGGFYVGRYEAGIPSNAPFYANTDGAEYVITNHIRNTTAYIPVSKPNNPSWNWTSQVNAKTVSEKMYSNSTSVESTLIDSYAWDTIVNWMESKNAGIATNGIDYGNYLSTSISLTDALYATYVYNYTTGTWVSFPSKYQKGTIEIPARSGGETTLYEIATGSTEETKVLNIYDMSGNMWEWTTEVGNHDAGISATQYAVVRGGSFHGNGEFSPLSYRGGDLTSAARHYNFGFRVVLYVK